MIKKRKTGPKVQRSPKGCRYKSIPSKIYMGLHKGATPHTVLHNYPSRYQRPFLVRQYAASTPERVCPNRPTAVGFATDMAAHCNFSLKICWAISVTLVLLRKSSLRISSLRETLSKARVTNEVIHLGGQKIHQEALHGVAWPQAA